MPGFNVWNTPANYVYGDMGGLRGYLTYAQYDEETGFYHYHIISHSLLSNSYRNELLVSVYGSWYPIYPLRAIHPTQLLSEGHRGASRTRFLDPCYMVQSDPGRFFCVGRVFSTLWSEPCSESAPQTSPENVSICIYGERIYTQIRRYVVLREKHGNCLACPIMTYNGRATRKPGCDPSSHSVVHTVDTAAQLLDDEKGIEFDPVAIVPSTANSGLVGSSRLNFAVIHTIQHNVKVKEIGMVKKSDLQKLTYYFFKELNRDYRSKGGSRINGVSQQNEGGSR